MASYNSRLAKKLKRELNMLSRHVGAALAVTEYPVGLPEGVEDRLDDLERRVGEAIAMVSKNLVGLLARVQMETDYDSEDIAETREFQDLRKVLMKSAFH